MLFDLYLFDLDDTLLDFQKSQICSFENAFLRCGIRDSLKKYFLDYKGISQTLWREFEKNRIKKDVLQVKRFELLFDKHSIEVSPEVFGDIYLEELVQNVFFMPNAIDVISSLKLSGAKIVIVTNGIKSVQEKRIRHSGIHNYIDYIVVSEDCGYAKPHIQIFKTAIQKSGRNPDSAVIIGDKLEADIMGGLNAGIHTCWYNPNLEDNPLKIKPNFEIKCLTEVLSLSK